MIDHSERLHQVYLGLGANLGDRELTICRAYQRIERLIGTIRRQSAYFYSEPWGFASDHQFVNSVILVETALAPLEVLHRTRLIERQLGKRPEHATERFQNFPLSASRSSLYHDRPIDIDILLYDDLHLDTPKLKIPPPHMQERDFVMIPLREITGASESHESST